MRGYELGICPVLSVCTYYVGMLWWQPRCPSNQLLSWAAEARLGFCKSHLPLPPPPPVPSLPLYLLTRGWHERALGMPWPG